MKFLDIYLICVFICDCYCKIDITISDQVENDKIKVITEGFENINKITDDFLLNYGITKDVIKDCMGEIKGYDFYKIIDFIHFENNAYSHFYKYSILPLTLKVTVEQHENFKKPILQLSDQLYAFNSFSDRNLTFTETVTTNQETSYTSKSSSDNEHNIELNLNLQKYGGIKYAYKYKYGIGNDNATKTVKTNTVTLSGPIFPKERIVVRAEKFTEIIYTKLLLNFELNNYIEIDLSELWHDKEIDEYHYYWFYPIEYIFERCSYFTDKMTIFKKLWAFENRADSPSILTAYNCNDYPEKCPIYYRSL